MQRFITILDQVQNKDLDKKTLVFSSHEHCSCGHTQKKGLSPLSVEEGSRPWIVRARIRKRQEFPKGTLCRFQVGYLRMTIASSSVILGTQCSSFSSR